MEQNDRPICRICLSTDRELQQQNIEFFKNRVCNCRGTTGGICHTCLEREIIIFNKWKCITCEQKYKHIEKICNNRWLDPGRCVSQKLVSQKLCFTKVAFHKNSFHKSCVSQKLRFTKTRFTKVAFHKNSFHKNSFHKVAIHKKLI